MDSEPAIPFGYRRVYGSAQRGDGIWDAAKGKFVKVRKVWPSTEPEPVILIRRCEVVQTEMPVESPCQNPGCGQTIVNRSDEACAQCGHCVKMEPEPAAGEVDLSGVEVMEI